MRRLICALLILAMPAGAAAQEPPHTHGAHGHRLGTVTLPNSGAAAAQEAFLRGVALLHSFEYVDAAESFREAQTVDPEFALAYWLEALTNSQLLWGREDTAAARSALRRLAPTREARLAFAGSAHERAWGAAVEALYVDGEQALRVRGYADSLRLLARRDEGDLEAAAFAAIALQMAAIVGSFAPDERAASRTEAIALAQRVFAANRDHPGAAHYLIHAYDDPAVAAQGLEVARVYAQIAPDAQHALHMPSHIFVQVGLWDDVVDSNERAWAASRAWVEQRAASPVELDFHSLEWLQHGYLQQGRFRAARALIDTARTALAGVDASGSVDPLFVVQRLAFRYAAEARDERAVVRGPDGAAVPADAASRYASFDLISRYQAAVSAALGGAADAPAIAVFRRLITDGTGGQPPRGYAAVMSLHVDAFTALARGERRAAIELLTSAAAAEEPISPIGPPTALPTLEWLGDALLEEGRAAEAADAYERALQRWPNRSRSLLGLARARAALGDHGPAAQAYARLLDNWHAADPELPELAEARRGAVRRP
jgi:tetratricopeptide (TPR) repeat protein